MNEENENQIDNDTNLVRLPLWRSCVEKMLKDGVTYGQTFTAEYFEAELRCKRDSMQFWPAIVKIRRELEEHGFYLSGKGQNGTQYVIVSPESNADVLLHFSRVAINSLRRGVILGTATPLNLLSESDRRRHESILEKIAIRTALVQKSSSIGKVLKKHAPKLLKAE